MPGLKKLTELELGLKIQSGAHSSVSKNQACHIEPENWAAYACTCIMLQVTDARATMALYRLHKAEWEQAMWKETQAFLAKQKKGAVLDPASGPGKKGHERDSAPGGIKRKTSVQDVTAAKRPKKAASSNNSGPSTTSRDDGNWWET